MNILSSLVLFGFQQVALAGSPYYNPVPVADNFKEWQHADKMGSVGSVDLGGGNVDLPLYHVDVSPLLYTYGGASAEKQEQIVALVPETSLIVVSESFANENEWEIKTTNKRLIPVPDDYKTGGEIKYVEIPELHIGKMVLQDVTAFVSGAETSGIDSTGSLNYKKMAIGLAALPVSYAILESEGLVRVTTEENGAKLLADFGGTAVPYQEMPWSIGTVGKWSLTGKTQTILPSLSLIIPATFGAEAKVSTLVNFSSGQSFLDRYYPVESKIFGYAYDLRLDYLTPNIGEDLSTTYITRPTLMDADDSTVPMAGLGAGVLSQYDIVVDQGSNKIAFKSANAHKRNPSFPIELERAKTDLEEAKKEAEEAEEGSIPVSEINAMISILKDGQNQKYADTIEYYDLLLADDEEKTDCALWKGYGSIQQKLGDLDKAREAYAESARLYHSWWDIELNTRMDINKAQEKMDEEETAEAKDRSKGKEINSVDDGWYISQPDSCYIADGLVASIDLIQGKHESIEKNYRENLDLDAGLARALGNSALVQGKTELSHEAYRQAVNLEDGKRQRSIHRLGLALIYADQGKWEQSSELFQEAMIGSRDVLIPQLWADNLRANVGPEKTIEALEAWNDTHPMDGEGKIALLREYRIQLTIANQELAAAVLPAPADGEPPVEPTPEQAAKLEAAKAKVAKLGKSADSASKEMAGFFADLERTYRFHPAIKAGLKADYALFSGDSAKAESLLESAQKEYVHGALFLSQANLLALKGDSAGADKALKKAAALHPTHAGYALFLK